MKTIFSKSIAILFLFVLFSCSKDSPTTPITPIIVAKTKVSITRIDVSQIPTLDGNGFNWDYSSNPDLYIKLYDQTNTLGYPTNYLSDFTPSIANPFSVIFSNLNTTNLTSGILKVQVWDDDLHDVPSNADDFISEVPFYVYDYTIGSNKYPSFDVKNVNGTIVTIYMTWE
jgi:hypothetical protein